MAGPGGTRAWKRVQRDRAGESCQSERGGSTPSSSATSPFQALQLNAGNRAVNRLLAPSATSAVPAVVEQLLERGNGQPLDSTTRKLMESRFGHDFGQVRVHTDAKADESARAVEAAAYTVGSDVVFASAQYQPETTAGRRLLAHEMAHVVQQSQSHRAESVTTRSNSAVLDAQATQASHAVDRQGGSVGPLSAGPISLARIPASERLPPRDITPDQVRELTNQLRDAIPAASQGRKTVAVGLVEDAQGHQPLVYTVNGNWSNKNLEARAQELGIARWQPRARASGRGDVGAPEDAEQLLIELANANGFRIRIVAPSRPACGDCQLAVEAEGGIYLAEPAKPVTQPPTKGAPVAKSSPSAGGSSAKTPAGPGQPPEEALGKAASPPGKTGSGAETQPKAVEKTSEKPSADPQAKGAVVEKQTTQSKSQSEAPPPIETPRGMVIAGRAMNVVALGAALIVELANLADKARVHRETLAVLASQEEKSKQFWAEHPDEGIMVVQALDYTVGPDEASRHHNLQVGLHWGGRSIQEAMRDYYRGLTGLPPEGHRQDRHHTFFIWVNGSVDVQKREFTEYPR
jgi:hypothetical protein